MTSKLKCPFCGKQMKIGMLDPDDSMGTVWMSIMPCDCVCSYGASKAVWQALIRAKQDLKIATKAFEDIDMLLHSRKFDITELGRLNIIQYLVSRVLKLIEHKE